MKVPTFLMQALIYILMITLTTLLAYAGDHPILSSTGPQKNSGNLFYLVFLQCMLMQHLSAHGMLCHCAKSKYSPFENKLVMFNMLMCCLILMFQTRLDVLQCIKGLLVVTLVGQTHFLLIAVNEIAHALSIKVFTIKKKATVGSNEETLL